MKTASSIQFNSVQFNSISISVSSHSLNFLGFHLQFFSLYLLQSFVTPFTLRSAVIFFPFSFASKIDYLIFFLEIFFGCVILEFELNLTRFDDGNVFRIVVIGIALDLLFYCYWRLRLQELEMASRLKEDEKNERIIRGLLKLEPNRRCINCNSLVRCSDKFYSSKFELYVINVCEIWSTLASLNGRFRLIM